MQEVFINIKGYEKLYQISNLGNVKSLPKEDGRNGRILKPEVLKNVHTNYNRVTLSKDGKTYRYAVHRLVAEHFLSNPESKPHVNHIDNNGENNCVDNLEWVTHSENMIHAQKQGRLFTAQSNGGKAAGKNALTQRINLIKSKINTEINGYIILGIVDETSKNTEVKCSCLNCGTETNVDYRYLISTNISMSNSCQTCKPFMVAREHEEAFKTKLDSTLEGTQVGIWKATGEYIMLRGKPRVEGEYAKVGRLYAHVICTCVNCNFNTTSIDYTRFLDNKQETCVICDGLKTTKLNEKIYRSRYDLD